MKNFFLIEFKFSQLTFAFPIDLYVLGPLAISAAATVVVVVAAV